MRISDWSSDVCSSDLTRRTVVAHGLLPESDPGEHALHEAVALREAVKHVHHFAVEQAEVADIAGDRLGGDAVVDAVEGSGAQALQPAVAPADAADGVHHFGDRQSGRKGKRVAVR